MNEQNPPIMRYIMEPPVDERPFFVENDSVLDKEELTSRIVINDPVNQFLKIPVMEKVKFVIKYKNRHD